jgi:hypothetical protein
MALLYGASFTLGDLVSSSSRGPVRRGQLDTLARTGRYGAGLFGWACLDRRSRQFLLLLGFHERAAVLGCRKNLAIITDLTPQSHKGLFSPLTSGGLSP